MIGTIQGIGAVTGTVQGNGNLTVGISIPEVVQTLPYEGAYEITPNDSEQTIPIVGLRATDNITIHPVPSNYGRIEWNGSELTVY